MGNIEFRMAALTNVGRVRTNNEDNFLVDSDLSDDKCFFTQNEQKDLGKKGALLVVADRVGAPRGLACGRGRDGGNECGGGGFPFSCRDHSGIFFSRTVDRRRDTKPAVYRAVYENDHRCGR